MTTLICSSTHGNGLSGRSVKPAGQQNYKIVNIQKKNQYQSIYCSNHNSFDHKWKSEAIQSRLANDDTKAFRFLEVKHPEF